MGARPAIFIDRDGTLNELVRVVREIDAETHVVVVPNFDIMVSADQTGQHIDLITREVIATLYENPALCLLGFKDPNLSVPKAVLEFFSRRIEVVGTDRHHLGRLITQAEARRFHVMEFDPYRLYKYVSGLNVVKLRQVLAGLTDDALVGLHALGPADAAMAGDAAHFAVDRVYKGLVADKDLLPCLQRRHRPSSALTFG